jgi:AcrR family transcriptional regulator
MHFQEHNSTKEAINSALRVAKNRSSAPRIRDRAAKEKALLLAGIKLFSSKGYEAATTREIATVAGCAEGLIHRYFGGKAGLLLALVRDRMRLEMNDLNRVPHAQNFAQEVVRLVEWEIDRMWEDRDFLRIVVSRAMVDPSLGKVLGELVESGRMRAMTGRLKHFPEGQRLQEGDMKNMTCAIGVFGFVFGFLRPEVLGRDRHSERDVATRLATILAVSC